MEVLRLKIEATTNTRAHIQTGGGTDSMCQWRWREVEVGISGRVRSGVQILCTIPGEININLPLDN